MTHQQETDWSKVPKGTLVEVRHADNDAWIPGYFLGYEPNNDYSYYIKASSLEEEWYGYKECRLYEGPGVLVWRDWHGGECPVPEGKMVVVVNRDRLLYVSGNPKLFLWEKRHFGADIIKYAIIEPPLEVVK